MRSVPGARCSMKREAAKAEITSDVELTRAAIQVRRQPLVTAAMDLEPKEDEAFWPLYREYRSAVAKVNDKQRDSNACFVATLVISCLTGRVGRRRRARLAKTALSILLCPPSTFILWPDGRMVAETTVTVGLALRR